MINMLTIVNHSVLYTWNIRREEILNSLTSQKMGLCDVMDVLTNLIMVIILQICVSNHYIIHVKPT